MTDAALAEIDLRYFYEDFDKRGNLRRYFRKRIPGSTRYRKVRLHADPGTEEFHGEFLAAMRNETPTTARPPAPTVDRESLRWLIEEYYRRSAKFRGYDTETQKVRRNLFKAICAESYKAGSDIVVGDLPALIPQEWIEELRDRKAETAVTTANAWVKALRQLYKWASTVKPEKLVASNTAKDVELLLEPDTGGHHTWSVEEIQAFIKRHPAGTKAYLALHLFLFTGQRLSDVAKLGKQHIRRPDQVGPEARRLHPGRWLAFRQHKNRNRKPVDLIIPVLPELEAVLKISTCGALTFLESEHGKPFGTKSLGNWFGDRCREAEVPGRAHGLRKAGATIAAERGATPHQLMPIYGWSTLQQAQLYTERVRKQLLAGSAMHLIVFDQTENECDPLSDAVDESGSISA